MTEHSGVPAACHHSQTHSHMFRQRIFAAFTLAYIAIHVNLHLSDSDIVGRDGEGSESREQIEEKTVLRKLTDVIRH